MFANEISEVVYLAVMTADSVVQAIDFVDQGDHILRQDMKPLVRLPRMREQIATRRGILRDLSIIEGLPFDDGLQRVFDSNPPLFGTHDAIIADLFEGVSGTIPKGLTILNNGNVGIGMTDPTSKLFVAGDITATGNITSTGNITAKFKDVAEWVPSSRRILAGTVVIVDPTKNNSVTPSTARYDTRVAGVVSAEPGVILGEGGEGKVKVATTGRVMVHVDVSGGPIHAGDLLVTSDKEGMAMRSEPIEIDGVQIHRPGTLIGKALESLETGQGEILVLLTLQ